MDWSAIAQLAIVAGGLTCWIVGWKHLRRAKDAADPDDWANRNSW